jgi:hypothetical protein
MVASLLDMQSILIGLEDSSVRMLWIRNFHHGVVPAFCEVVAISGNHLSGQGGVEKDHLVMLDRGGERWR